MPTSRCLPGFGCVCVLGLAALGSLLQQATAQTPAKSPQSRAVAAATTDWPQFRGPTGQGVAASAKLPDEWSDTQNILWKVELPAAGTSAPITFGKQMYLTGHTGFADGQPQLHLINLDRATGKLVWQKSVNPELPEQENIREEHGYASSTPVADAQRVYAFFGKSGVHAYNHQGQPVWQADVGSGLNGWGSAASPILVGKLLIVNASVESESLVALNATTGKEVWRVGGIRESWNTPVLVTLPGGKQELVLAIFGKILGIDPVNGKELWSCDTDIGWYMVPSLVEHGGVIYCIGGRSGGALAVKAGGRGDVTQTHRLWTGKKGSNVTSPVYHNGHLYWMNDNQGIAYCAEAKTGRIVYEKRVQGAEQVYASPVLANGKIYQVSRSGRSFVIAAKPEFELISTNDFGHRGVFNASHAVDGNRLLVRCEQTLWCIGQK